MDTLLWAVSNYYYIPIWVLMVPIFMMITFLVCSNILGYIVFYNIRLTHDFDIIFIESFNKRIVRIIN